MANERETELLTDIQRIIRRHGAYSSSLALELVRYIEYREGKLTDTGYPRYLEKLRDGTATLEDNPVFAK